MSDSNERSPSGRSRGRPATFPGEAKKARSVDLTERGWEGFKQQAKELGMSAQELIEWVGRGSVVYTEQFGDTQIVTLRLEKNTRDEP